jgi:hypothetical protein
MTDSGQAGIASMAAEYHRRGWWGTTTIADIVAGQAASQGGSPAFAAGDHRLSWTDYDQQSSRLAALLAHPAGSGCAAASGSPCGCRTCRCFMSSTWPWRRPAA